jgi:predicted DNA-binding transcriptional regulator YafY
VPDSAARLLRLLGLLQRRAAWSGTELAERLEVDARTVRRDIDRLRSLGYQIDGVPGTAGGYHLGGGTDVPPMLFEDDEAMAIAVVLGLSAGAAVPGIERSALTALAKLDRLLPHRLRARLSVLRAATVSLIPPSEVVSTESLILLAEACDNHQRAHYAYRTHDGQESERRVEPHRLVATDRRWYLVAFDLGREDWRTFRVDRISSVKVPGHTFVPRPLRDPGKLVAEGITTSHYRHTATVLVKAPMAEVATVIAPHVGVLSAEGAITVMTLGIDDFEWLPSYLIGLGLEFEVREPVALREFVASLGERLHAAHRQ